MSKTWIQSAEPKTWPQGWSFPAPPWPPGWPRKGKILSNVVASADFIHGFLFDVQNEFGEPDDGLNGECLHVRAYDGEKLIRLRPHGDGPWYDGAMLKIGNLLSDRHWGAKAKFDFDVQRVSGDVLMVIADVYGVTPRHGTGIPIKVEVLR